MRKLELIKSSAIAISLGLACAMPAAAQNASDGSSSGQSASTGSSGQNASTGQSSPSDFNQSRSNDNNHDWGWLGLLGLIGLAGLRRREDRTRYDTGARKST